MVNLIGVPRLRVCQGDRFGFYGGNILKAGGKCVVVGDSLMAVTFSVRAESEMMSVKMEERGGVDRLGPRWVVGSKGPTGLMIARGNQSVGCF